MIPISIVILMTMLTFFVGGDMQSRLGMCITALHSESTRELPTIGYVVLFDRVYILAYWRSSGPCWRRWCRSGYAIPGGWP